MKYAVISDIHSNLEALKAVIAKAESEGADRYICAGDIVGYNADPLECIATVRSLYPLSVVRGNHDEYVGNDREPNIFNEYAGDAIIWTRQQLAEPQRKWLGQLKLKEVKDKDDITVVHATLDSPESWKYIFDVYEAEVNFPYLTTQFCFFGHSHKPLLFKKDCTHGSNSVDIVEVHEWPAPNGESEIIVPVETGWKYLVNIGSVGQPRDGDVRASFVIYDSSKKILKRICVEYDIAAVQKKVRKAGLPEILAARLEYGF